MGLMLQTEADGGTSQSSLGLESKFSVDTAESYSEPNLFAKIENKIVDLYTNDGFYVLIASVGGMAAIVYPYWGFDFGFLTAENGGKDVAVPLIVRTSYGIQDWMAGNALLNLIGVWSSSGGSERLGKVIADRNYHKHKSQLLEKVVAKIYDSRERGKELTRHGARKMKLDGLSTYVDKQLEESSNKYAAWLERNLSRVGAVTYAGFQAGIICTFMLVDAGHDIDGGLIWNDLLIGAGSGITMHVSGKYLQGLKNFYQRLKN